MKTTEFIARYKPCPDGQKFAEKYENMSHVWVAQIKKEISDVYKFAGEVEPAAMPSEDDLVLLAELGL